jgi:hypothetical protein
MNRAAILHGLINASNREPHIRIDTELNSQCIKFKWRKSGVTNLQTCHCSTIFSKILLPHTMKNPAWPTYEFISGPGKYL